MVGPALPEFLLREQSRHQPMPSSNSVLEGKSKARVRRQVQVHKLVESRNQSRTDQTDRADRGKAKLGIHWAEHYSES